MQKLATGSDVNPLQVIVTLRVPLPKDLCYTSALAGA
jgi:hypothetical protein